MRGSDRTLRSLQLEITRFLSISPVPLHVEISLKKKKSFLETLKFCTFSLTPTDFTGLLLATLILMFGERLISFHLIRVCLPLINTRAVRFTPLNCFSNFLYFFFWWPQTEAFINIKNGGRPSCGGGRDRERERQRSNRNDLLNIYCKLTDDSGKEQRKAFKLFTKALEKNLMAKNYAIST